MEHIIVNHLNDFKVYGYDNEEKIADLIIKTIKNQHYVRYGAGQVYKITNKEGKLIMYLMIRVSINGFIMNSYPYDKKPLPDWVKEKLDELEI